MARFIWVVDDVADPPLMDEHGYAMWIDAPGGQVLLDTAGSGEVLLHNLDSLGLDPLRLDAVVLSHAHDDHTGGLLALSGLLRPGIPVHAHPTLLTQRYSTKSGTPVARGLSHSAADLTESVDLRLSAAPVEVVPGVWTTGAVQPRPDPEGRSRHHFIERDGELVPDPYSDDLSLVARVADDQVALICGCCHAGLLNTLATAQRVCREPIVAIAGGVHLAGAADDIIAQTVAKLASLSSLRMLWLGHCSGATFIESARAALPDVTVRQQTAGAILSLDGGGVVCV